MLVVAEAMMSHTKSKGRPSRLQASEETGRLIVEVGVAFVFISLPNVRDDGSPLAFGMTPAREAESAGGMSKVPKAW
jgi:hypothetical protein